MTDQQNPKEWQSFEQQINRLKQRGLIITDEEKALKYLKTIGYYRLSGYAYPFRQNNPETPKHKLDMFAIGTSFEDVKDLYVFDKKLRLLTIDALERIEIALRVDIAYILGKKNPIAYNDKKYFHNKFQHQKWLDKFKKQVDREKKSDVVKHHHDNYTDLPIWVACELWDFGTMSTLYRGLQNEDKNRIANFYKLSGGAQLQTHLHALNILRNVSAHHSRLWNKKILVKADFRNLEDSQWRELSDEYPFAYFCLMKRMLDIICPNSLWGQRFLKLLNDFPIIEKNIVSLERDMGMTTKIEDWDLWSGKKMAPKT